MKRIYSAPTIKAVKMMSHRRLLGASDVYYDDPQKPGNALSRRRNAWDDDEDDDME